MGKLSACAAVYYETTRCDEETLQMGTSEIKSPDNGRDPKSRRINEEGYDFLMHFTGLGINRLPGLFTSE